MNKVLVTYFSAGGVTERVARRLAAVTQGDLYRIEPEQEYTRQDLDWTDKQSRSTLEMNDPDCRPALKDRNADVADADVVYVGFPIWWYREPSIVDSFLDAYDFKGKTVIPFATSGVTLLGKTPDRFRKLLGSGVKVLNGSRFRADISEEELKDWVEKLH